MQDSQSTMMKKRAFSINNASLLTSYYITFSIVTLSWILRNLTSSKLTTVLAKENYLPTGRKRKDPLCGSLRRTIFFFPAQHGRHFLANQTKAQQQQQQRPFDSLDHQP